MDLEEGSKGTNGTYNKPTLTSDGEKEPINETDSGDVSFPNIMDLNIPFLPASSISNEYCCIYRVPCLLRRENPDAYTPQMLLIGPLHHSKKAQANELSKTDLRYLDYMKLEGHKEKYLENFARYYKDQTVEDIIKRDEELIRASYAESTDSIKSDDFVKMMLNNSVFIIMFFMQTEHRYKYKTGDFLFDVPSLQMIILQDLFLLENQLPFFLLENLYESFCAKFQVVNITFRDIILGAFGFKDKIKPEVKFRHFTDLFRCVRVETLDLTAKLKKKPIIRPFHNADKLDNAGVEFVGIQTGENILSDISLVIKFEGGILKMPSFIAEDRTERILRNIMALEQCHYPYDAFVCNYIIFLNNLINTVQDVDLLISKGVILNLMGSPESVAKMLNNLCSGVGDFGSHYYEIAENLNNHYRNRLNRSVATLRRVYFKDLWTGTATVAAVVILVLTLIGTVASVLQVTQNDNNCTKFLPPPTRKP